jgi:hypothetical protein
MFNNLKKSIYFLSSIMISMENENSSSKQEKINYEYFLSCEEKNPNNEGEKCRMAWYNSAFESLLYSFVDIKELNKYLSSIFNIAATENIIYERISNRKNKENETIIERFINPVFFKKMLNDGLARVFLTENRMSCDITAVYTKVENQYFDIGACCFENEAGTICDSDWEKERNFFCTSLLDEKNLNILSKKTQNIIHQYSVENYNNKSLDLLKKELLESIKKKGVNVQDLFWFFFANEIYIPEKNITEYCELYFWILNYFSYGYENSPEFVKLAKTDGMELPEDKTCNIFIYKDELHRLNVAIDLADIDGVNDKKKSSFFIKMHDSLSSHEKFQDATIKVELINLSKLEILEKICEKLNKLCLIEYQKQPSATEKIEQMEQVEEKMQALQLKINQTMKPLLKIVKQKKLDVEQKELEYQQSRQKTEETILNLEKMMKEGKERSPELKKTDLNQNLSSTTKRSSPKYYFIALISITTTILGLIYLFFIKNKKKMKIKI